MGSVWRAHHLTLDVDVAIKVLRRNDPDDEKAPPRRERLLQEARAAARLGHPAIAHVFEYGVTAQGDAFIAMELLRGEDLAGALMRRGRLSATKAVATLLPIIHGLAYAHQKGIVHRDIKPENIYLARGDDHRVQPKLVDFGIAKMDRCSDVRLTQAGTTLGSPLYMSPEQACGCDADHRADVWALCVVLYEAIAGITPFEADNSTALMYSIIAKEPVPLCAMGLGDDALWAVLDRGLRKDPEQRWQTVRELGTELARWLQSRGQKEDITGWSLSQQWFQRIVSGADLLASLVPAPDPAARAAFLSVPPDFDVDVSDLNATLDVAQPHWQNDAEESTFTGGALSVAASERTSPRLAAIAFAGAACGALLAGAWVGDDREPDPVIYDAAMAQAPELGLASAEARPAAEPVPVAAKHTFLGEPNPELCPPSSTTESAQGATSPQAKAAVKASAKADRHSPEQHTRAVPHSSQRARHALSPGKKNSGLKNPFQ
jgi:serine/threonine-protein kinase